MKLIVILFLISCYVTTYTSAQTRGAVLLGDTSTNVIYQDALNIFGDEVFPGTNKKMQDSFMTAYYDLAYRLGTYQKGTVLKSGDTLKVWWKVYFDKTGTVDGMIFNVLNRNLTDAASEKVYEQAREFVRKEKIPMHSIYSFSQCGSIAIIIP